ncbi:hypothetical protein [Methylomonas sp. ZR1]|uniref:hypothetical protein n=1 Tax=Methylomonas sp. ZR1 TaxID=1797072 RepID=UPI001490C47C|nr:hypothetical protein [Methylomonas sp. ZR1]NOV32568.1 hypothetical protein [Methylomonas sp. ZR1]
MKINKNCGYPALVVRAMLAIGMGMASASADAATLNAPSGGTFTMNLDRNALAPYAGGYYLSTFWSTATSNADNPANTGDHLLSQLNTTEISGLNQVFELTAIGSDPSPQASQRYVKATSADFAIDTGTLAGVAGAQVGMTGVQGFYAPNWPPTGAGLVNGDFSLFYDANRQTLGRTGWYLANNIYFTMAVYDLNNLSLSFSNPGNWQLSGDLLMSPENAGMLQGAQLVDVGSFCLGTGAYAGCGQVSAVPLPAAVWLFASGFLGFIGIGRRPYLSRSVTL